MQKKCFFALAVFLPLLIFSSDAFSAKIDCRSCHRLLASEKVVHPAVEMGCPVCHTAVDVSKFPHRMTNKIAKGLSAQQPELCYGCHDMAIFTKKNVHAAIGMGCTGCHNPHSSKNSKLLRADPPELCFSCHDKSPFTDKRVHPPVAAGMCMSCHTPHSSEVSPILLKKEYDLCVDCHPDIPKKAHVISGFGIGKHPLGEPKITKKGEVKQLKNPAKPDKVFYCGSCHNPHSTQVKGLLQFNALSSQELCANCHKK
jgi:predicted CXXCH cytochrome family protein